MRALRAQGQATDVPARCGPQQAQRSVVESLESAVRYCRDLKFGQTKTASHDRAYERTSKNEVIPMRYIIDSLAA